MKDLNVPIYRAKRIDKLFYVKGLLKQCTDTGSQLWIQSRDFVDYQIDESTLSIHFPGMLDSKGNEIFASLSEDGKGGDIADVHIFTQELAKNLGVTEGEKEFKATFVFTNCGYALKVCEELEPVCFYGGVNEESFKITGIQE